MNDEELVEQIKLGNDNAAEELIKRYYSSILRYCTWHCSSLEKAEDLTQETFLKLFMNIPQYDTGKRGSPQKSFRLYLYTIAKHLCIDENRKMKVYSLENEESIVSERNEILQIENREDIKRLMSVLSSEQREAIILRFGEQLRFKEIANIMGCNMRTAQSRVRKALKIMRKRQDYER
ncbi:MAG: RNA polymerase sigma factor [Lachnospiraceae bacterium]